MKTNKLPTINYQKLSRFLLLSIYCVIIWLVLPISLAIFLAYFLYPAIHFFHRKLKIPYFLSTIFISSLLFGLAYSLFYITFDSIITIYPEVKKQVENMKIMDTPNLIILESVFTKSLSYIDSAIMTIADVLQDFFSYMVDLFIFIVAFYFSLFESKRNRLWFFIYVPKKFRNEWKEYFIKATNLFGYFLYVEFQLLIITFILLSCGLALLQFDHPINKAFLISIADSLPFFGIGLFLIPISIYFFIVGKKFLSLCLIILYIFIQLTRQLMESFLWSSTFHLRMVHTFFITATSILLFGFYGILLSPFFLLIAVKIKQRSISE